MQPVFDTIGAFPAGVFAAREVEPVVAVVALRPISPHLAQSRQVDTRLRCNVQILHVVTGDKLVLLRDHSLQHIVLVLLADVEHRVAYQHHPFNHFGRIQQKIKLISSPHRFVMSGSCGSSCIGSLCDSCRWFSGLPCGGGRVGCSTTAARELCYIVRS